MSGTLQTGLNRSRYVNVHPSANPTVKYRSVSWSWKLTHNYISCTPSCINRVNMPLLQIKHGQFLLMGEVLTMFEYIDGKSLTQACDKPAKNNRTRTYTHHIIEDGHDDYGGPSAKRQKTKAPSKSRPKRIERQCLNFEQALKSAAIRRPLLSPPVNVDARLSGRTVIYKFSKEEGWCVGVMRKLMTPASKRKPAVFSVHWTADNTISPAKMDLKAYRADGKSNIVGSWALAKVPLQRVESSDSSDNGSPESSERSDSD